MSKIKLMWKLRRALSDHQARELIELVADLDGHEDVLGGRAAIAKALRELDEMERAL